MEINGVTEPNSALENHSNLDEDSDDPPVLSSQALEALKEFLAEQQVAISGYNIHGGDAEEVALVSEDWKLSQFWYEPETAKTVAQEVLTLCQSMSLQVACIACPTLYAYLKKIDPATNVQLLEYDDRFQRYGNDFIFYDYNQPEALPSELKHAYQVVIADPPYLSKECLVKVAQTVSFLSQPGQTHLLLLTGEVLKDVVAELLGLHPCGFQPQHSSKLGNEFRLFMNYDPGTRLGGWEK